MTSETTYSVLNNSRFYILLTTVLLSMAGFAWLRLAIDSDQLLYIRVQQVFGLLAIIYWYIALVISPVGYIVGKQRVAGIAFARRAIGVSAFYFALLHGVIAIWGQLGGLSQLATLPTLFMWSILMGGVALIILGLMAATSFDKVVRFMTFRKWKWLHRFVYLAAALTLLHIWMIGTHLAYSAVQWTAFGAIVVLLGLEMYRMFDGLNKKYLHLSRSELLTLFFTIWIILSLAVGALPNYVQNYHGRHTDHSSSVDTGVIG